MDPGNGSGSEAVTRHLPCMGVKTAKTDMGGEAYTVISPFFLCLADFSDI